MADPVINNVVRAQSIWQAKSGLPTDRFVTSWAFVRSGTGVKDGEGQSAEVAERLREFWLEPTDDAPTESVSRFLAPMVATEGLTIKTYDLGQTPPREPTTYEFTGVSGSGTGLPREVAVTSSFYATRNLPRQRGRVYIGPLSDRARLQLTDGSVVPDGVFLRVVAYAMHRLVHGRGVTDEMQLGVLSPTDGEIRPVTDGWIDNAFDTIRSRGEDPTFRQQWGPAGVVLP